jgi:hypothetical protein
VLRTCQGTMSHSRCCRVWPLGLERLRSWLVQRRAPPCTLAQVVASTGDTAGSSFPCGSILT